MRERTTSPIWSRPSGGKNDDRCAFASIGLFPFEKATDGRSDRQVTLENGVARILRFSGFHVDWEFTPNLEYSVIEAVLRAGVRRPANYGVVIFLARFPE